MYKMSIKTLLMGALASMAAASVRFVANKTDHDGFNKKYLGYGTHVHYRYRNRKTTTAATLKRAAKKRAHLRARSKK